MAMKPLFLGLELAVDQLRATIVDENLELVGVECVDFDTELPEYQTAGGIFTSPGEAYTTPVEMWIKALDMLLQKLHQTSLVPRIKSISGCAQHALVWWKSTAVPSLATLDPHLPLHNHFPAPSFSLPNTPTAQDTSSHTHALAIEALLGGPETMAQRVGTCATASLVAAQLLRVRETWPQDVWARTGRVQLASAFLASLISGKWVPMSEAEASATGIWVHSPGGTGPNAASVVGSGPQGYWEENVLDIVGGSREEGRRVRGWLGDVDVSGGARKIGNVSRYLVERFGFESDTIVTPFTSDYLATYLSLCPSPSDAVLSFGPMDSLMTPAGHYLPTRLYSLFPHPAQEPGEKRKYIAMLTSRNADVPRALVRDMYTKSWSAFDRLVAIVPPGGSIGLDDKLFSFWHLQGDVFPLERVKGIFRFETGVKVQEFRDLRANPRCLVESQILSFRVRWGRILQAGLLQPNQTAPPQPIPTVLPPTSPFLPFKPTDRTFLPKRILAVGAAANFPAIANIVGDVFNAPVYVPATQVDSVQLPWGSPQRNAPGKGYPARASLGMAWVGRWVWAKVGSAGSGVIGGSVVGAGSGGGAGVVGGGRSRSGSVSTHPGTPDRGASPVWGGKGGFEDEVKRIFGRRWVMSGQAWAKTSVGAPAAAGGKIPRQAHLSAILASVDFGASSLIGGQYQSKVGSQQTSANNAATGTSSSTPGTPTMHTGTSSPARGLGNSVVIEEEEEEHGLAASSSGFSAISASTSNWSVLSSNVSAGSSAFTTPDLSLQGLSSLGLPEQGGISPNMTGIAHNGLQPQPGQQASTTSNPNPNPTPLTPVVALQTGDSEAQMGLAKVAEPDSDAFLTYAALIPEFCRLEGMLIKGVV